jgi:FG-GAP repeat
VVLTAGDFDGDGRTDVAVADSGDNAVTILFAAGCR